MATRDGGLESGIRDLLGSRPGWRLEPQATPGLPPQWCFGPGGRTRLAVGVGDGAVSLYLEDLDRDLRLPDVATLAGWLDANESRFAAPDAPGAEDLDLLVRRTLREWHRPGT